MTDLAPQLVAVAGDWHCNPNWAEWQIKHICEGPLKNEDRRIIIHCGDFGFWPRDMDGVFYLDVVEQALADSNAELWFVDGNHEDHPELAQHKMLDWEIHLLESSHHAGAGISPVRPHLSWINRGTRWTWNGKIWLGLGGAVSVDQGMLTEGVSWFPQEEITRAEADAVKAAGHADIMITHDCPSSVVMALPPPSRAWLPFIPKSEIHRELLQDVVDAVQPSHLVHGHYHRGYSKTVPMGHGLVRVTGLSEDGTQHNWHIMDTRTLEWVS